MAEWDSDLYITMAGSKSKVYLTLSASSSWTSLMSSLTLGIQAPPWAAPLKATRQGRD